MTFSDYDVDVNPDKYEREGLDVDQGCNPDEGCEKPEYLEDEDGDD